MTEHTDGGGHEPRPDDEQLAAYLDGELDAVATRRLEQRLIDEPDLAERLDTLADTLVELRRIDDVEAPAGYHTRLAERLHAEWARGDAATREVTVRPRRRWRGALAAAAAVALVAVAVPAVLQLGAPRDDAADVEGLAVEDVDERHEMDAEAEPDEEAEAPDAELEAAEPSPEAREDEPPEVDDAPPAVGDEEATRQTLPPLEVDARGEVDEVAALWPRYDGLSALAAPVEIIGPTELEERAADVDAALDDLGAGACAAAVRELFPADHAVVRLERVRVDGVSHLVVVAAFGEGRGEAVALSLSDCEVTDRAAVTR